MEKFKTIALCVVPFIVTALMMYPFMAIVGANTDPFMWERTDRVFYGICTALFGWALFIRVNTEEK